MAGSSYSDGKLFTFGAVALLLLGALAVWLTSPGSLGLGIRKDVAAVRRYFEPKP